MDVNIARWLQQSRMEPADIARIHAYEQRIGWIGSAGVFDDINARLGQFWSKGKLENERADEVRAFERRIYPVWAAIFDREGSGLDSMHRADMAIRGLGYRVNYGAGQNENVQTGADY
jgi:hypothetical protein